MSVLLFASPIIRLAAQGGNKTSSNDIAKSSSTAELERLKFYLGDWDYSEVYEKSALFPNGGRNTGSWTAQVGPQGRSIIHAFVSHGTGDNYEGIEVMTWDTKEKVYRDHSLWYDSADQWTYVGHFEGDLLVYRGEFEFDGKHVKFRSETRPRLGGGFTLDEFMSVDGGPEQKVLRGTAAPRTQAELLQNDVLTLKQLEQDELDAYREGDAEKMDKILADDFVGRWADGSTTDKRRTVEPIRTGAEKHFANQLVECNVRIYSDMAVVTGVNTEQSILEGRDGSGTISFTDVFVKRQGRWQLVASETKRVSLQSMNSPRGGETDEQAIMELERRWARAEEAFDPKVLNEILANEFVSMDEIGKIRNKAQEIASDGEWKPPGPEVVDEMSVHLDGDTAICLGRFTWTDRSFGSVKLQGRFVDTFLRRKGRWQVVANSYIRTDGLAQ